MFKSQIDGEDTPKEGEEKSGEETPEGDKTPENPSEENL